MFRAKINVNRVIRYVGSDQIIASPVTNTKLGPAGENEDNTFARYTPAGEITLTISNPDLVGVIQPGDQFYVDFRPIEKPMSHFYREDLAKPAV